MRQDYDRVQREKEEREKELKELKDQMSSNAEAAAELEAAIGPIIAGQEGKNLITVINLTEDVPSAGTYIPDESETLSSSLGGLGLITEVF